MQNDQQQIINSLVDLGLKENEARVYLATLKLGQATVGKIAEAADLQRTFVYDILADLKDKGLASEIEIRGTKHYNAVSVNRLKEIQKKKFQVFEAFIPELKAMEKSVGDRPRVQFFEGAEGIMSALSDTLNQPDGSQILAYATGEGFYSDHPKWIADYLRKRIKKRIAVCAIGPDNATNRDYLAHDKEHMRTTVLISQEDFPFTNEIDIYGNKVLILSLIGELVAVIVESESIANTQRAIFKLSLLGAKTLQK